MDRNWVTALEDVNEVRLRGVCGEIAYRPLPGGQQILSCRLDCEHFSVLLLVRGAPREIRDKVFQTGKEIQIIGRLGHNIDFFIDVFVAEALPIRDQKKRLAEKGVQHPQWVEQQN